MNRKRRNPPQGTEPRRRSRARTPGEAARRRIQLSPEVELSDEELLALADEGIDPEEVRRLARERPAGEERVSPHDRDTVRDELEGLTLEDDE